MKKLRLLTKSLLVAAGLCVGVDGAWADSFVPTVKMTYVDYDNPDTSFGEIAAGETAKTGYHKTPSDGGTIAFNTPSWGVNFITYLQVDASDLPDGATITNATLSFDQSGSTDNKRTTKVGAGYNSSTWSSTMTYNTADKTIHLLGSQVETTTKASGTFENKEINITAAFAGEDDNVVTILLYETAAAGCYIKNPAVSITYTTETVYNVTFTETNGVKATVTISGDDVTSGTSLANGNYSFTATAEGYNDYNGDFTVSGAAKNVEFTMTPKTRYTFTVNAVSGGSVIKKLYEDSESYEGKNHYVGLSKYLTDDENVVTHVKADNTFYASYVAAGETETKSIDYNVYSGTAYFVEGETLGALGTKADNGNYSGNKAARGASSSLDVLTVPAAGAYKLTYAVCSNNVNYTYTYNFLKNDDAIFAPTGCNWSVNNVKTTGTKSVENVVFAADDVLKFNPSNTNLFLDYVLLEAAAPATGTIPSSGYGSLASAYGLDFANATVSTGELTAYAVTSTTSESITLTKVDELPANSGVILKGTASATYSIPVKADAAYDGTNLLKAAVTATPIAANEAYILQGGQFHLVTNASTVPAGKAYLLASDVTGGARALGFSFDDDVTGISTVSTALQNGEFYNLQGLRVSQPAKGLYIVNGKKVIIK